MADTRLEPLVLTGDEQRTLENWVKRRSTAQGLALRARIVLSCAQGGSNVAVAARLGVSRTTVRKWRTRFLRDRLDGLPDEPRPGVPRTITDAQVEEVVVRTLEEVPEGATHWPERELAARVGISPTSVHRIWRAFWAATLADRDIQALPGPAADRQDPRRRGPVSGPAGERGGLQRGRKTADPGPGTHRPGAPDDSRSARAAQLRLRPARHNRPVRRAEHRHRQGHWQTVGPAPGGGLPRLPRPDRPPDRPRPGRPRDLRQPRRPQAPVVQRWLLAHPRFVLHFTPTYSSWINQAGRWLAELQRRCLDRGVFCSLDELTAAPEDWIKLWNQGARPFTWTKTADQIIDRICRYCSRISGPGH